MEWSIDRDSDVPIHKQVENLLRELISQEEYQQGKLLPGESEISDRLDISRNTVRVAMQRLVEEDLITRKKGFGSVVSREKTKVNLRDWINLTSELTGNETDIQVYEKSLSWELPPENVWNSFDVDPHIQIPKLKIVLGDKIGPTALFVTYFHPRIGIEKDETFEGNPYEDILESKYDVTPHISDEQIETKLPEPDLRETLDIDRLVQMLHRERIVSDENGDVLELNECDYRSDRFLFEFNMTRDAATVEVD